MKRLLRIVARDAKLNAGRNHCGVPECLLIGKVDVQIVVRFAVVLSRQALQGIAGLSRMQGESIGLQRDIGLLPVLDSC